jgi:membrane-bound metal-dependent hydrolase YbcI (DUF457 family)
MFIGHFALGLAAKRAVPGASLPALLAAPELLDFVWPVFLLSGAETVRIAPGITASTPLDFTSYPWSHSLLMAAVWGALFSGTMWLVTRRTSVAAVVFGLVVSHWVLDWVTHRPDLPLSPWGTARLGLGLWNFRAATLAVEGAMFAAGVALYARGTRPRDRVGVFAFWALVIFLTVSHLGAAFGPPPPDVRTLAYGSLALWLLPLWAWWIERHRIPAA